MPHMDELYPSRFLKGTTLERPITIRIVSLTGELLEGEEGETKPKAILRYKTAGPDGQPVEGEIVWCKTNAILAAAALGTPDYKAWCGRLLTIQADPGVMFGKERVGGIRVCGSPELKKAVTVDVKRPRRRKAERYTLQPTDGQGRVRGAPAPQTSAPAASPPDAPGDAQEPA